MWNVLGVSNSIASPTNAPSPSITELRMPENPLFPIGDFFIPGMNSETLETIPLFDELPHSFAARLINLALERRRSLFITGLSMSFERIPIKCDLSYASGDSTGSALGPISNLPSHLHIQWGSRNGNSGYLGTV